jgi:hypothetical protein
LLWSREIFAQDSWNLTLTVVRTPRLVCHTFLAGF